MKKIWARIRQWFTTKLDGGHSTEPRPASGVPEERSPARKINGNPKTEPATDNPSQPPNEDDNPRPQPEPTEIESPPTELEPPKDQPQEESPPATAPPELEPQPEPDPQHTPASPEETSPVEEPSPSCIPSESPGEDHTSKPKPETTDTPEPKEDSPQNPPVDKPESPQPTKKHIEDTRKLPPSELSPEVPEPKAPSIDPQPRKKRDPNKPREKPGKYPGKREPTPTRTPDPEKETTKRRFKPRPALICRESNNGWEILLSMPEELNTVRVLQQNKSLSHVNNEYMLDDFSNPITIIQDGNKHKELSLTPPIVFKTSEDWIGIGRQVKQVTKGHFVIIAPYQWDCRTEVSVEPDECLDSNYLAHFIYCDPATDKDTPIFDECKELYKTEILRLKGATVFDQSKKGTLYVQSPPDLKMSNEITWGRVGYEERTGGWSKNFEPHKESLAELLSEREGHFFIRVYDKDCQLVDSDQFRYYSNLKEIRLNGISYQPDQYIFPSESEGHTEAIITFIGADGQLLTPESKEGQGIVDKNGRITVEPDRQIKDETTWVLKSEFGNEVEVVLTIPRIWWCLENDKERGLWYDQPISMSRRQFIDRARSGTQLVLHPENITKVHCGFNQDMSQQHRIQTGLPLLSFIDYEELQTPLLEQIDFSISLNDFVFSVINIVEPPVSLKQLIEAGVHFGHQTRRWNPKMAPYIFGERNGIHIIDLRRTLEEIDRALAFVRDLAAGGGVVLFVGTKKQAQAAVQEAAGRAGMPYVNFRWLGGMLTNFKTINQRIFYMKELAAMEESGDIDRLPKKERLRLRREFAHLERTLGGVAEMDRPPSAVFVIDLNAEHIAVREAVRLGIPVIALVDTNCNPDDIDFVIPGNDDAIRAASLIANAVSDACLEGTRSSRKLTPSGHPPP